MIRARDVAADFRRHASEGKKISLLVSWLHAVLLSESADPHAPEFPDPSTNVTFPPETASRGHQATREPVAFRGRMLMCRNVLQATGAGRLRGMNPAQRYVPLCLRAIFPSWDADSAHTPKTARLSAGKLSGRLSDQSIRPVYRTHLVIR